MKLFLKRTGLFLLLLLSFFLIAFGLLDFIVNKAFDNYRVGPKVTIAIMGDSHPQCAINDALLSNSQNFAQAAEASYYTYFKMKTLLDQNPSIKTIYLGLGPHNITTHYDQYIYGDRAKDIAARYFFILPLKDKVDLIFLNPGKALELLENSWSEGLKNGDLNNPKNTILGHYENFFSNVTATKSAMDKRLKVQFSLNGNLRGFSEFNINYINKMADLCQSKNVALIAINTPVHSYYKNRIPKKFQSRLNQILKAKNVKCFNFDALQLKDSDFVPDGDHISAEGAIFTTALFRE